VICEKKLILVTKLGPVPQEDFSAFLVNL